MKIKAIKVEIYPSQTAVHSHVVNDIRIEVQVHGKEPYFLHEMIPDNDFESYFDYFWRRAKTQIETAIKNDK